MIQSRYRQVRTGMDLFSIYYAWLCKECGALSHDADQHDRWHESQETP